MCKLKKVANAKKEAAGRDADEPDRDVSEELAAGAPADPDTDPDPDPSTSGRAAAVIGNVVPMWAAGNARSKAQPGADAEGILACGRRIYQACIPNLKVLMRVIKSSI